MATFVLVHGAFHGAWCWVKLVPELERFGHQAIAIDLPGAGDDATPLHEVTMGRSVQHLADVMESAGEPVILVGHSLAGMVVSQVAEWYPEYVRQLVYLAALVPADGHSLDTLMGAMVDPDGPHSAVPAIHDPWEGVAQQPPLAEIADRFYNDCSAEDIAYARERLRPQPNEPRLAVVDLTPERFGRIPKSFIACELDNAMPAYRRRINAHTGLFDRVVSLHTGHSPFFSAPEILAASLDSLAR